MSIPLIVEIVPWQNSRQLAGLSTRFTSLRIPSTDCWNGTVGGPMKIYHEVCGQQVETEIPVIKMNQGLFDLKIRSFLDAVKNGTLATAAAVEAHLVDKVAEAIARGDD